MTTPDFHKLIADDAYDDHDCSDYEDSDYSDYASDEEDESEYQVSGRKKKTADASDLSSYHSDSDESILYDGTSIPVESPEESRARYARLAKIASDPNTSPEDLAAVYFDACLHMKGIVKAMINRKFATYTSRDPEFRMDLIQRAYEFICKYLSKYDYTKGQPSTYFTQYILSALVAETNLSKNCIKSSDATLIKKIKTIRRQREQIGQTATMKDYLVETGEKYDKIKAVLQIMSQQTAHLEAIEGYDQLIPGNCEKNETYLSPETLAIRDTTYGELYDRIRALLSDRELKIFTLSKLENMSVPEIVEKLGEQGTEENIRRCITTIVNRLKYDVKIRQIARPAVPDEARINVTVLPTEDIKKNMDDLEDLSFDKL